MAVWHFAELYGGAALVLAALVMFRYIVIRSSGADADARKAFRPLFLVAIALLILGLGSISIYIEDVVILSGILFDGTRYAYLLAYATGVIMISVAGVWILDNRKLYALPIGGLVTTIVLLVFALEIDPSNQAFYEDLGSFILSIILILVGAIFVWIAKETQRGTSASLAFAFVAQIGSIPRLYEVWLTDELSLIVIFFLMMGPALVIYSFIKTDIPPTFELIGYGAAFSAAMLILASVSNLPVPLTFGAYAIVGIGAIGAMLCLATSSFLFGRWRESKQSPTLIYMFAFGAFYLSQMIGLFLATGVIADPILGLYDFALMGMAFALMSTAAIYATGRTSIALSPIIAFVPVMTFMILSFEGSTGDLYRANLPLMLIILAVFLLPVPIFLAVWWRMRAAGSLASSRPLGLALGIILYFLARLPPLFSLQTGLHIGYAAVTASFLLTWLALTGRLNKKESVTA